jgi:hypothetical protein
MITAVILALQSLFIVGDRMERNRKFTNDLHKAFEPTWEERMRQQRKEMGITEEEYKAAYEQLFGKKP